MLLWILLLSCVLFTFISSLYTFHYHFLFSFTIFRITSHFTFRILYILSLSFRIPFMLLLSFLFMLSISFLYHFFYVLSWYILYTFHYRFFICFSFTFHLSCKWGLYEHFICFHLLCILSYFFCVWHCSHIRTLFMCTRTIHVYGYYSHIRRIGNTFSLYFLVCFSYSLHSSLFLFRMVLFTYTYTIHVYGNYTRI